MTEQKNFCCSNFYSSLYCTGDSPIRKVVSHLKTGIQVHLVTLPVWFSKSSGVPREAHSLTSLNCSQLWGDRVWCCSIAGVARKATCFPGCSAAPCASWTGLHSGIKGWAGKSRKITKMFHSHWVMIFLLMKFEQSAAFSLGAYLGITVTSVVTP